MVPGADTTDEPVDSNNPPDLASVPPPLPGSSAKPFLRRISESIEPRKLLFRTWSANNLQSESQNSPTLLKRFGGLSLWASTPAVSGSGGNDDSGGVVVKEAPLKQEPTYEVVVEEDSPDEEIPLPDMKNLSLSRKSNLVSLNSKMHRSMSSLSIFKAPRIRRKRKRGKIGNGIEPLTQNLSYEGEIDMDIKLLGSEKFVEQRYQDTARLIYIEWRQLTKSKSRLNADEHYKMSQKNCKQM